MRCSSAQGPTFPFRQERSRNTSLPSWVRDLRRKFSRLVGIDWDIHAIAAAQADAGEAWMIEDGKITEGGSSSAFILTQNDVLVTRENSSSILPGCTRKAVVKLAEER